MAEALPEDCLSHVISFTSPRDACRAALVAGSFRRAADSDLAWEKIPAAGLPPDYLQVGCSGGVLFH
ncbi:UNVERIFIED_CONTAM: F-box protein [Sesamum radiatum]|uniref:F-box protein n=1 Tax=Sesamum radiatum TaxID=300843 RepID=A0AAW2MX06_SESRA